jgi:hypothetical protein
LKPNPPQLSSSQSHDRSPKSWDRWITTIILVTLLIPLPFARLEAQSNGNVILEKIVMPWSTFRICYVSFPDGKPVEEVYRFTWKGVLLSHNKPMPLLSEVSSLHPPTLQWQGTPEKMLKEVFYGGDFLDVKTSWRPIILWPVLMGMRMSTAQ